MKKLLVIAFLALCAHWAEAQYYHIPYTTSSLMAGARTVTVTTTGASGVGSGTCSLDYALGAASGSSKWDFDQPVGGIRFHITNIDGTDHVSFNVNGSPVCLTGANITTWSCSGTSSAVASGCDVIKGGTGINETQVDIKNCSGINSVEIIYTPGTGGIEYDIEYNPNYAGSIVFFEGLDRICSGDTKSLSAIAAPGGTWTRSPTSVLPTFGPGATSLDLVTTAAVVSTPTTATITYTAPGALACAAILVVTVNPLPTPISLSAPSAWACMYGTGHGADVSLTSSPVAPNEYDLTQNGYWVGPTLTAGGGTFFGTFPIANPTDYFESWVRNPITGCMDHWSSSLAISAPVVVIPSGVTTAYDCLGFPIPSVTTYGTSYPGGGTWLSSNTAVATIGATSGIVQAEGLGLAFMSCGVVLSGGTCTLVQGFSALACKPGREPDPIVAKTITDFKTYPNPTTGTLTLEAPTGGVFSIYTLEGRSIMEYAAEQGTATLTLPASLPSGLYIGQWRGKDGTVTTTHVTYSPE